MSATEVVVRRDGHLVLVATGESLDLSTPEGIGDALSLLDSLTGQLRDAKSDVTAVAVEVCAHEGVRTLGLADGRRIELSSDHETKYDAEQIRDGLLSAGMPQDRVDEVCVPSFKVNAAKAKQAAAANEDYRRVIEDHTRREPKKVYASVKS